MDPDCESNLTGTIPQIMGLGGVKIKAMMVSGENNEEAEEQLREYVIGFKYDIKGD